MSYRLTKGSFPSHNQLCDVAWYYYHPEHIAVRAVAVICHGMGEHISRYEEFIGFLCQKGIAVYGCDHLGHGDSVNAEQPEYGFFGENEKTLDVLVENQRILVETVRKKYRHLPLLMFGHSMGSFVVRKYMVTYGDTVDGVILCGTGGANKAVGVGIALLSLISLFGGKKKRSQLADKLMFGGYNKRFPGEGEHGWLTKDDEYRQKYAADPKSNFIFTVSATQCLLRTHKEVNAPEWYGMVPQGLPVLIVSGEDDPVGNYGEGVAQVYGGLEDAELCMLKMKLYQNDRHNILHEIDRETVFADLLAFIEDVADGVYAARTYDRFEVNE